MPISDAFPQDRVARGLAIKTQYEAPVLSTPKGRPVKIFAPCLAQESVSVASEPYDFVSLADTAVKFGYKSTAYAIAKMLKPKFGIGVGSIPITFFPVAVTGSPDQAAGSITPTGSCTVAQTYVIKINNWPALEVSMTGATGGSTVADFCDLAVAAINSVLDLPVTATDGTTKVDLEVGFETAAGNFVHIEIESPTGAELTFALVQPTGGAGTIDISTAWAVFNDNWYSHVVNGVSDATNSTVLDSASVFNELRWSPEVHKPFKMYTGSNEATAATIKAITDARKSDRTNSIKWTPGSNDAPWAIAARTCAMLAMTSNADPSQDAQLRRCDYLTAGPAASQLDSGQRDQAVKVGLSTVEIIDSAVYLSDNIMCYHPAGEDPPAWRKDVAIEKECYMIYNLDLIFSDPADAGNALAPDGTPTTNPNVRKPSYWQTKIDALMDGAARVGIVADAEYAKENSTVDISGSNGDRIDVTAVYQLTGNASVNSVTNKFSYYAG